MCSPTYLGSMTIGYYVNSRYKYDFFYSCTAANVTRSCSIENQQFEAESSYMSLANFNDTAFECFSLFKTSGPKEIKTYLGLIFGSFYTIVLLFLFLTFRHFHRNGSLFVFFPSFETRQAAADLGHADVERISFVSSFSSELSGQRQLAQGDLTSSNAQASLELQMQLGAGLHGRLKSVDTFRGLSLILMIFVNYGGGGYWYFNHSPWDGLTLADLVFPWFVFIMGVSISITMKSLSGNELRMRPRSAVGKILKRTLILFFVGLIISNRDVLVDTLRIMGVLQRLSIAYCFVALLTLVNARYSQKANISVLSRRATSDFKNGVADNLLDLVPFVVEWIVVLLLVAVWTLITFVVQIDGCPRGYVGPGGLQYDPDYNLTNCTGGVAGFIDRTVFGLDHTYQHPTARQIYGYNVLPYDPEGLLGCLTSIFLTFCGLHAGRVICIYWHWKPVMLRLLVCAIVTGVLGGGLCQLNTTSGPIPVNKNLWSLSFVLITACLGFTILAILYIMVDVLKWWDGAPFTYAGMNSLLLYVGHELLEGWFPFSWGVQYPTHEVFMIENITACAFWLAIAGYCNHIQFYLKV
ncbi:heparan-alpha-glucosaminide N-acetyltransferase-like isoform X2 [Symsagittifera roscoffensis]|uniref:heparan-alpha-glucosaminide N-acetyltransferase-like isoform X2 n=1 Tax=Symsagittifera roscoffensis TaxID=84072 RepID=UPI00307BAEFD